MRHAAARAMDGVFQEIGVVERVDGEQLEVTTGSGRFTARAAVSCLVAPQVSDRVLVAVPAAGDLFVLAILEREGGELQLRADRDLRIEAEGTLTIAATDRLELRSPVEVGATTRNLRFDAVGADVTVDRLSFVGRFVEANADTVKLVLSTLDSALDRLTQRVKRSYRFVEELDMTRAQAIDTRAAQTMTLRAKNAFVGAEELVKVDGDQIHMG